MQITSNFNRDAELLLADRVEKYLLEEIGQMSGRGEMLLPQQQELAGRYGVSLRTIRTAVDRLKARNLIRSIKGKGMFIQPLARDSGNVLVVAENFTHPYTSMVAAIAGDQLLRQGLTPVMAGARELDKLADGARGMLVVESSRATEMFLGGTRLPYCGINDVFTGNLRQPVWHQTVRGNYYLAGYVATEILLAAGKEKIVFFGHSPRQDQINGYRDAFLNRGMAYDAELVFFVPREKEPGVEEFCRLVHERIERRIGEGDSMGFVDCSGSITYQEGNLFPVIMKGLFGPEDTVATGHVELEKPYLAGTKVLTAITPLVNRAIDLVLGRSEPYSVCETLDRLQVAVDENGRWRNCDYREYFVRQGHTLAATLPV